MNTKIQWLLDEEEEEVDPIDPVGSISITDGTSTIVQQYTYLDSWFDALVTGLHEVQAGNRAVVDLVEEPDPLVIEPKGDGVQVSYRGTVIFAKTVDEYKSALQVAAREFLKKLDEVEGSEKNQVLNSVRVMVSS